MQFGHSIVLADDCQQLNPLGRYRELSWLVPDHPVILDIHRPYPSQKSLSQQRYIQTFRYYRGADVVCLKIADLHLFNHYLLATHFAAGAAGDGLQLILVPAESQFARIVTRKCNHSCTGIDQKPDFAVINIDIGVEMSVGFTLERDFVGQQLFDIVIFAAVKSVITLCNDHLCRTRFAYQDDAIGIAGWHEPADDNHENKKNGQICFNDMQS